MYFNLVEKMLSPSELDFFPENAQTYGESAIMPSGMLLDSNPELKTNNAMGHNTEKITNMLFRFVGAKCYKNCMFLF